MNTLNIPDYAQALGFKAKQASALMAHAQAATKKRALRTLAALLRSNVAILQIDNARDTERAMADVIGEIIGMKQMPSGIRGAVDQTLHNG
jgi:glutamate-5-semialdehyde dehydrogenase